MVQETIYAHQIEGIIKEIWQLRRHAISDDWLQPRNRERIDTNLMAVDGILRDLKQIISQ